MGDVIQFPKKAPTEQERKVIYLQSIIKDNVAKMSWYRQQLLQMQTELNRIRRSIIKLIHDETRSKD